MNQNSANALSIRCPECKAQAGSACVNAVTQKQARTHMLRVERAASMHHGVSKRVEEREQIILAALQAGLSNQEISLKTDIAQYIVERDVATLLKRYKASSRAGLVVGVWSAALLRIGKTA